ncbi:MAG: DNA polymerase I [Actinobacteria bacterium]|nr:DNA polymerase I [Actinomycetota bacterium]
MAPGARPRLMVLDAPSLLHRAYHAVPAHFTSATGEPTNAVYGFVATLFRLVGELEPDYAAAAFDLPGDTFRHGKYDAYKANRPEADASLIVQFDRARQVLEALGIPRYELAGYEADDFLGTLARQAEAAGLDTYLVTGDRDAYQLISPHVWVLSSNPRTGDPVLHDAATLRERWGIRPEQVADFKGLVGDPSDNIPGVPGIGEKTAAALLQAHGDLATIYAHLDQLKPAIRSRLDGHSAQAELSRELATIITDLPVALDLDRARLWQADASAVRATFQDLRFRSLLERLPFGTPPPVQGVLVVEEASTAVPPDVVSSDPAAQGLADTLARAGRVAVYPLVDAPLTGPELVGLGLAWDGGQAFVPVLEAPTGLPALARWFADPACAKVTFDSKQLYRVLARQGTTVAGVDMDLLLASYLVNPGAVPASLDDLAYRRLNRELMPPPSAWPRDRGLAGLDPVQRAAAAAVRAHAALPLAEAMRAEMADARRLKLLQDVELPLAPVLAEMEEAGIAVDAAALQTLASAMQTEIAALEAQIYADVGHQFNINSTKQLGEILFEELHLPSGRRTKSGYSTASEVLEGLAGVHPIVPHVLDYRAVTKLKSTYVDALPALVNPRTGRIHTSFNQAVAATGRLSSTNPNLQNIPIRTERGREIRRAFVAGGPDLLLLSVDYSQIDLRVLAHFSEDPAMIAAFSAGLDIHAATAAQLFGIEVDRVSADQRRLAKTTNFGIVYGISAQGLAQRTELSNREAAAFINGYFATYPGVRAYMEKTLAMARERGYVETLLGRRRYVPELHARAYGERAAAERIAINMPIQGTSADIIKVAMVNLARELRRRGLHSRMLLQVHDELVFEAPRRELDTLAPLAKDLMSSAVKLRVPVVTEAKVGTNWRDMSEI